MAAKKLGKKAPVRKSRTKHMVIEISGYHVKRPVVDGAVMYTPTDELLSSRRVMVMFPKCSDDTLMPVRVPRRLIPQLKAMANSAGEIDIARWDFLNLIGINPTKPQSAFEAAGEAKGQVKIEVNFPEPQMAAEEEINILLKANDIIYGDREKAYGNPRFNLDTIAQLWSVYLSRKFPKSQADLRVTAEDVSQFMILLKTARLIHNPTHVDSLVDQAGYAALQHRIQRL